MFWPPVSSLKWSNESRWAHMTCTRDVFVSWYTNLQLFNFLNCSWIIFFFPEQIKSLRHNIHPISSPARKRGGGMVCILSCLASPKIHSLCKQLYLKLYIMSHAQWLEDIMSCFKTCLILLNITWCETWLLKDNSLTVVPFLFCFIFSYYECLQVLDFIISVAE